MTEAELQKRIAYQFGLINGNICGRRIDVDSEYPEGTLGKFDYLCDECRKEI